MPREAWLAGGLACLCCVLVLTTMKTPSPTVLFAQPPLGIATTPLFPHHVVYQRPESDGLDDMEGFQNDEFIPAEETAPAVQKAGQLASPNRIASVFPPYYHGYLPSTAEAAWKSDHGFSWSPYGHYSNRPGAPRGSWHIPYPYGAFSQVGFNKQALT
jgi:hypothetical protein